MLAVQCAVCVALVMVMWLFAQFGGNAAKQLRGYLKARLEDNSVATAVSLWVQDLVSDKTDEESPPASHAAFVAEIGKHQSTVAVAPVDTALPIAPSDATVTSLFGERENPTATGDEFHKGLDLAAAAGTPIAAIRFGIVIETGEDVWLGNYVMLSHGDVQITYAHCRDIAVSVGDTVKAGDTVATVGSTGNSTGNHLHVEMYKNGVLGDPAQWIAVSAYD